MNRLKNNLYLFVGGGSGGHLTPMIPVAEAVLEHDKDAKIIHIGQRGDMLNSIIASSDLFLSQRRVFAGKFRRYNGEKIFTKLLDVKTFLFNVRDFFFFLFGIIESWFLLGRLKPSVIFMKGGYVCAPVGIAAGLRKIPYITHDSDAMVSLAHRLIAKNAEKHTTAMNPSYYTPQYDLTKTIQVGVPVRSEFRHVTDRIMKEAKERLGLDDESRVLLVVGGGLGSKNINDAVVQGSKLLLEDVNTRIIHITGHKLLNSVMKEYRKVLSENLLKRVKIMAFSDELHSFSAAANVIITRAGATNMAEFAAQGKACIIVPNPLLAGGHQLKNAEAYISNDAAIIVEESNAKDNLVGVAITLLNDEKKQRELSTSLYDMSSTSAAKAIADELIKISSNDLQKS